EFFGEQLRVNKRRRGRNVIGGSFTIIERLRRSCRTVLGRWSRFSQPSSAAAMRVCFERRCMKFTFRVFSGGMPASRLMLSEQPGHYFLLWFNSSKTDAGDYSLKRPSKGRILPRKISFSSSCRRGST